MRAVAYCLFNYDGKTENWASFSTYLRGFFVNCRINRVIYPEWVTVLNIDSETYNSEYHELFKWLENRLQIQVYIRPSGEKLCRAMLWRVQTAFEMEGSNWKYTHTLCRDADSISNYREAQAVYQWVKEDRAIHCITDSISHDIPMLGGMIGLRPGYINDHLKVTDNQGAIMQNLLAMAPDIDYTRKGSDQEFLNRIIYPVIAQRQSSTEHFVLGMKQTIKEGNGRYYSIPDIELSVDPVHKFLNGCAGHIGAAGFYEGAMIQWLNKIDPHRTEYIGIQKQFPRLMFWQQ